jgi:hypothetical protein
MARAPAYEGLGLSALGARSQQEDKWHNADGTDEGSQDLGERHQCGFHAECMEPGDRSGKWAARPGRRLTNPAALGSCRD